MKKNDFKNLVETENISTEQSPLARVGSVISKCRSCQSDLIISFNQRLLSEPSEFFISKVSKKNIDLVKCKHCHLVQLAGIESASEITNFYRELEDQSYDLQAESRELSFQFDLKKMKNKIDYPRRILEIGAFTGLGAKAIGKTFSESFYLGIEPSKWAAVQAQRQGLNVLPLAVEDLQSIQEFDTILSWDVLEHLENPNLFFKSLPIDKSRASYLFINCPDWNSVWRRVFQKKWWFVETKHRTYFDRTSLTHLASQYGWSLIGYWPHRKCRSLNYIVQRLANAFGFRDLSRFLPKLTVNYFPGQTGFLFRKLPESNIR